MNHQQLIELGLSYNGTSLRYPFDPGYHIKRGGAR